MPKHKQLVRTYVKGCQSSKEPETQVYPDHRASAYSRYDTIRNFYILLYRDGEHILLMDMTFLSSPIYPTSSLPSTKPS